MQPTRKTPRTRPGFDVTCTIGRVELDGNGEHSPYEAAMLLIARHGAPGTYQFPGELAPCTVTVEFEELAQ